MFTGIEGERWAFPFQPCGRATPASTRIPPGLLIIRPALDVPFLLLPFRPSSDPSAARTFIRNYFNQSFERGSPVNGDALTQELRLYEPMVRNSQLQSLFGQMIMLYIRNWSGRFS